MEFAMFHIMAQPKTNCLFRTFRVKESFWAKKQSCILVFVNKFPSKSRMVLVLFTTVILISRQNSNFLILKLTSTIQQFIGQLQVTQQKKSIKIQLKLWFSNIILGLLKELWIVQTHFYISYVREVGPIIDRQRTLLSNQQFLNYLPKQFWREIQTHGLLQFSHLYC